MLARRVGGLSWGYEVKIQGLIWDENAITLSIKQPLAK